jgi:hypothetical protein
VSRQTLRARSAHDFVSDPVVGVTLDREWTEWAAKAGASPTVAAALHQISRSRPPPDIVARLTPGEFEWVTEIVGRWPDCFPSGTLAALKGCTLTPSPQRPTDLSSLQRAAHTSVESRHGHPARKRAGRPFEHPRSDREWTEWAAKAGASPTVAAALHQISRSRPPPDIVARLTPGEFEWVTEIVGRWPDCFPSGTLAALKGCTLTPSPQRPTDLRHFQKCRGKRSVPGARTTSSAIRWLRRSSERSR